MLADWRRENARGQGREAHEQGKQRDMKEKQRSQHDGSSRFSKRSARQAGRQHVGNGNSWAARHALVRAGGRTVGAPLLAAALSWTAIRAGVQAFHLARRHQLRVLLGELCRALSQLEQTYWLDFGGLLGIHRDSDLILHDSDIDLAVLDPDWHALEAGLRKRLPGYAMKRLTPSEDPTATILRVYCPLGMADIFAARRLPGGQLWVDCGHGCEGSTIAADTVFPTSTLDWRGMSISVPAAIEKVLEQRYGATWRVPRYLDKGADTIEHGKWYNKLLRGIATTGIRI